MTTLEQQESLVIVQSQYDQNKVLIESIQQDLKQKTATISMHDLRYAEEYIQDTVNVFRFLKDSDFDPVKTTQRLLETLQWRLDNQTHTLDYQHSIEFCPVAFFRNHDLMNQPLLFVNLRHYPTQSHTAERILPYATLIMEIARKLTLEKTLSTGSLISQITVVVDIQKAPFVGIDREIVRTMELVLSVHFPGMIGSINVMNFGWLYQGLWSVIQCFLNQEQKDSIRFVRLSQLKKIIDTDFILKDLGGADPYAWTLASDTVLHQYGKPLELPNTPPASVSTSSEDEFFDALQSPPPRTHSTQSVPPTESPTQPIPPTESMPPTRPAPVPIPPTESPTQPIPPTESMPPTRPAPLPIPPTESPTQPIPPTESMPPTRPAPVPIPPTESPTQPIPPTESNTQPIPRQTIQPQDILLFGRKPQPTQPQRRRESSVIVVAPPLPVQRTYTDHLLRFLSAHQGIAYWAGLYLLIRGPIETMAHKLLAKTSMQPQTLSTTALGLTATVAAITSSTLANSLAKQ